MSAFGNGLGVVDVAAAVAVVVVIDNDYADNNDDSYCDYCNSVDLLPLTSAFSARFDFV